MSEHCRINAFESWILMNSGPGIWKINQHYNAACWVLLSYSRHIPSRNTTRAYNLRKCFSIKWYINWCNVYYLKIYILSHSGIYRQMLTIILISGSIQSLEGAIFKFLSSVIISYIVYIALQHYRHVATISWLIHTIHIHTHENTSYPLIFCLHANNIPVDLNC